MRLRLLALRQGRILAAIWLTVVLLNTFGGVTLVSWSAQRIAADVAWVITPLVLLWLAFWLPRGPIRLIAIAISSLLYFVCFIGISWEIAVGQNLDQPTDPGFEPIVRQPSTRGTLVLYRTNCGATCSFGLELQQEWGLVPGLKLARRLSGWYPADSAVITPFAPAAIRVDIGPYGYKYPVVRTDTVRLLMHPFLP